MTEYLKGIAVVAGTAVGKVKVISQDTPRNLSEYKADNSEGEAAKFLAALDEAGDQLREIIKSVRKNGEDKLADIMGAHLEMLGDPVLKEAVLQKIGESVPAPQATLAVIKEYSAMFGVLEDNYLRERAADILDIGNRIVRILLKVGDIELGHTPVILCAQEIEPSVLAGISQDVVQGLVLGQKSTVSHAVIIAKSKGLVTIVGVADLQKLKDGTEIILDGYSGEILISPEQAELDKYLDRVRKETERLVRDQENASEPAVTIDGTKVRLAANISRPQDMDQALKYGCEGVGLYRTEFLFMGRDTPPSEEEQFQYYRQVVESCGEHLCIIRTMDIGGDKPLPYLNIGQEDNPFLGWRAIRISLERSDLFIAQLKAILRAGVYGKVAIMLPMIISAGEISRSKDYLSRAIADLNREQKKFAQNVPFGIMVETPAAAVMAPFLAKESDFFSIGTNDLVQYTLAVDRGNSKVSNLYNYFHPAVLRLIDGVIRAAHENGKWAAMCGEMAGDPHAAALLMGMGIDELSMNAPSIPRVKEQIRGMTMTYAQELLQHVLTLNDGGQIQSYLTEMLERSIK